MKRNYVILVEVNKPEVSLYNKLIDIMPNIIIASYSLDKSKTLMASLTLF